MTEIPAYSFPGRPDEIDGCPFRVVHTPDGPVTVVGDGDRWTGWSFDLGWMDPVPAGESIVMTSVTLITQ